MMTQCRWLVFLLVWTPIPWAIPWADAYERPAVRVAFHLDDPDYRDKYSKAEDLIKFENDVAKKLMGLLERRLGFVHITEDDDAPFTFRVRLIRNEGTGKDTSFNLSIEGLKNGSIIEPWPFRSHMEHGAPLSVDLVSDKFVEELGRRNKDLIVCHMSQIPLCKKMIVIKEEGATHCILPCSHGNLLARANTVLQVKHKKSAGLIKTPKWYHIQTIEYEDEIASVPLAYRAGIVAKNHLLLGACVFEATPLAEIPTPGEIGIFELTVDGVYMTEYQADPNPTLREHRAEDVGFADE